MSVVGYMFCESLNGITILELLHDVMFYLVLNARVLCNLISTLTENTKIKPEVNIRFLMVKCCLSLPG